MKPILLRVTYRVRAHEIQAFETVFREEILPLVREHQLSFQGLWKTLVGDAGEFLELWSFDSLADFESKWQALMRDGRLQQIFEKTGPLVEGENFTLLEPVTLSGPAIPSDRQFKV